MRAKPPPKKPEVMAHVEGSGRKKLCEDHSVGTIEIYGRRSSRMRISMTSSLKPGVCFAKPVHEADPASSERPVTMISMSSIPNTPGGPGAIRLADREALNRPPSCSQFPMQENVVSPPLSAPLVRNSTIPEPTPIGVLNQMEYLPSMNI